MRCKKLILSQVYRTFGMSHSERDHVSAIQELFVRVANLQPDKTDDGQLVNFCDMLRAFALALFKINLNSKPNSKPIADAKMVLYLDCIYGSAVFLMHHSMDRPSRDPCRRLIIYAISHIQSMITKSPDSANIIAVVLERLSKYKDDTMSEQERNVWTQLHINFLEHLVAIRQSSKCTPIVATLKHIGVAALDYQNIERTIYEDTYGCRAPDLSDDPYPLCVIDDAVYGECVRRKPAPRVIRAQYRGGDWLDICHDNKDLVRIIVDDEIYTALPMIFYSNTPILYTKKVIKLL